MEKDINALQAIVNTVADITGETIDNLEDGKISKLELMGYMDNLVPAITAAMGTKEAIEEVKAGLNDEERADLVAGMKAHFDIENDELEEVIEEIIDAVFDMVEVGFSVYKAIKKIKEL